MHVSKRRLQTITLLSFCLGLAALTANANELTAEKCFLWQVQSKNSTVYLLGSIHMLRPEMHPLDACMEHAYDQADAIAVEVNMLAVDPQEMSKLIQKNGYYPPEKSLQSELSPNTLGLLKKYLNNRPLSFEQIQQMRPWYLGILIAQQEMVAHGFDPALGIDLYFLQKAQGKKEIIELETAEQQIKLLASTSAKIQELSLLDTLQHQNKMGQDIAQMVEAWQSGDAEYLYQLVRESENRHPSLTPFFKQIFDQRNHEMSNKIKQLLKTGKHTLVIVGGGHLGGEKGLIKLLDKKPYSVKQLNKSPSE